jgi:hypothetical protein
VSIFGWDLPPGCSMRDIENAMGSEGPMDCPVCTDGVELDGPDCTVDPNHGVTCPKHGCISCQNLESKREYCATCGNYLMSTHPVFTDDAGKKFCSEQCRKYFDVSEEDFDTTLYEDHVTGPVEDYDQMAKDRDI